MPMLAQDIVVTIAALGCAGYVVSRVVGLVRPRKAPGCAKCPSSNAQTDVPASEQVPEAQPLVFIRSPRR